MHKIAAIFANLLLAAFPTASFSEGSQPAKAAPSIPTIPLWPDGKMPGQGAPKPEEIKYDTGGNVYTLTYVSQSDIAVFKAPGANPGTPAMIICPGGGYGLLAYRGEGVEVAKWLNSIGITGVLLKYRVPNNRNGALQDIQRAVRLVRFHANEWNINPERLGVIGFSAGGHLCVRLSTSYVKDAYPKIDTVDEVSCRPDFVVLVYPGYLADATGQLAPEFSITPNIPPTLIVHTDDDLHHIAGSRAYFAALQARHLPVEFCCFTTGSHGYGMHPKPNTEAVAWPQHCQDWLIKNGILGSAGAKK